MPIGIVACIVRDKIPCYLSNVPIPRSLRGFFDLTFDEWIQLVSFSAICGGLLYVTAYPIYVVYYPEFLKEFNQLSKPVKSKRGKVSKLEELDIEDLGSRTKFCRCWKSKSFPFCDGCHTCSVFKQTPLVIVRRNQETPSHRNRQQDHRPNKRKCDARNVLPIDDTCFGNNTMEKYHDFPTNLPDNSDTSVTSFVTPNDDSSVNSADLNAIKSGANQEPKALVNFIQPQKESLKRERNTSGSNTTFVVGKQSVTANNFVYETPPSEAQPNYKYPFPGFDLDTIPEMIYSMELETHTYRTPFVDFGIKNDPMQVVNYLESQEDPFPDFDLEGFKGSRTINSNKHPKQGGNEHLRVGSSRPCKPQKKFIINSELNGIIKSNKRANAFQRTNTSELNGVINPNKRANTVQITPTSECSKKVAAGKNVRVERNPGSHETKDLFNSEVLMEPDSVFLEYMKAVDEMNADGLRHRKSPTVLRVDEEFEKIKSLSSLFVRCDSFSSSPTATEPNTRKDEMVAERYSNRSSENSSVCNMDDGIKLDEIVPSSLLVKCDSLSLISRTEELNGEENLERSINIVRDNGQDVEVENVLSKDSNDIDAKRYLKYLRLVVLATAKIPKDYDDD